MSTLLLRLAAPLQSWGDESRFTTRGTRALPTKSGVVGLLAAALGRDRTQSVDDLAGLRMAVRADRPGRRLHDFHSAHAPGAKNPNISDRHYLSDAIFLVGLEGDPLLLADLDQAVRRPAFPLFLGRRSCPPTLPVSLGVRETTLVEAIEQEPWQGTPWSRRETQPGTVHLQVEGQPGQDGDRQKDVPISFDSRHRRYGSRVVISRRMSLSGLSTEDFMEAVEP